MDALGTSVTFTVSELSNAHDYNDCVGPKNNSRNIKSEQNNTDSKENKRVEECNRTFCHPAATGLFTEMDTVVRNCVAHWKHDDTVVAPKHVESIDLNVPQDMKNVNLGYDIASANAIPRDENSSHPISKILTPAHAVLLSLSMATQRLPNELQNEHLLHQTMLLAIRENELHEHVTSILKKFQGEVPFLFSPIDDKKVGQASSFLWWNLLQCNRDLIRESWQRIGISKCSKQLMSQNDFTSSHLFRLLHDEAPAFMALEKFEYPSKGAVRPPVEFKSGNFERSPISDLLEDSLVETWTALLSFAHGDGIEVQPSEVSSSIPRNEFEHTKFDSVNVQVSEHERNVIDTNTNDLNNNDITFPETQEMD